jgi:copper chaperone CopZ
VRLPRDGITARPSFRFNFLTIRVTKVVVSYKDKTAVVTYDETKADVKALTTATTNAGYPSAPKS